VRTAVLSRERLVRGLVSRAIHDRRRRPAALAPTLSLPPQDDQADGVIAAGIKQTKQRSTTMKLKLELRPGTKLSDRFDNRRDCYKVVETDNVFGYIVLSGGPESTAVVYPLYRADLHMKVGKTWHFVTSYEQGDRLNDTFQADYEGCTFATIASQAIRALEERRHLQQLAKQRATVEQREAKKRRKGSR
jgi:hypothetical protein